MFFYLRNLLKQSGIYLIGTLASRVVGFLMIPVYTRYLSPSDYGIIELLELFTTIAGYMIGMGLGSAIMRFYYDYENEKEKKCVISSAFAFNIGFGIFVIGLCLFFDKEISKLLLGSSIFSNYVRITMLSLLFQISVSISENYMRIRDRSILFITFSFLRLFVALGLNIYFIVFARMGVFGILLSTLISTIGIFISMNVWLFREVGFSVSKKKICEMVLFGYPLIFSGMAMVLLESGDMYILKLLAGLDQVGLYALGSKFGAVLVLIVGQPFFLVWGPKLFEIAKMENYEEMYSRITEYFILFLTLGGVFLAIFSPDAIQIMAPHNFHRAAIVVPFIVLGVIFKQSYYLFPIGIQLSKKTYWMPFIVVAAASVKIGLGYLMIRSYGLLGAGGASAISFLILPTLTYFISRRYLMIHYRFFRIMKIFVSGGIVYLGTILIPETSIVISIIIKVLIFSCFPIVLFLTRFFEFKEVKKLYEISPEIVRNYPPLNKYLDNWTKGGESRIFLSS